jgi:hypothetical protein
MRSSLLTRSAVAVASLAIGSVALAAAPASADTASGTTRQTVLSIAEQARHGDPYNDDSIALVKKVCAIGELGLDFQLVPAQAPNGVDGFLVEAYVDSSPSRSCTFAAFAAERPVSSMSGTATITVSQPPLQESDQLSRAAAAPSHDFALSSDVYVTAPVDDIGFGDSGVATASGNVTSTEAATTTRSRVVTPKSTQHKRAAYKAYNRTLDKAQAKLTKALKKANGSSTKKAAARKAYAARKKAALAKRHAALDGTKTTVVRTVPQTSTKAFTFTTAAPVVLPPIEAF